MTNSVAGWKRSSKPLSKAKLAPKKYHGHWLVVFCRSDTLQLSESWWSSYIWEVCSANQWDILKTAIAATCICQQNGPNSFLQQCLTSCSTTNTSKVEQIELQHFASSSIFTWPLAIWLPLLQASRQLFTGKMLPRPFGRKCFPIVHRLPKHGFLLYRNKQTYFSLAKICWL